MKRMLRHSPSRASACSVRFRTSNRGLVLAPLFLVVLLGPVVARSQQPSSAPALAPGVLHDRIAAIVDPSHSYALYLPSAYSPDRRWPILYAFDPFARGDLPVSRFQAAAEKFGYIVVGSHNARNGPDAPLDQAADILWRDTHARFSLDDRRIYVTGLSGMARFAASLALRCNCVAGVFAHGASFRGPSVPDRIPFPFFAAVGNLDFNYAEVVSVYNELDRRNLSVRLRLFEGPHGWAPEEVWLEATEWFELLAMRDASRPVEASFVTRQLATRTVHARNLERGGDVYAALREYRSLVRDFQALADVSEFSRRAEELEKDPAAHRGRSAEEDEIRRQHQLADSLLSELRAVRDNPRDQERRARLRKGGLDLKKQRDHDLSGSDLALRRAASQVLAAAFEFGVIARESKELEASLACLQIAAGIFPEAPGVRFELARTYAVRGDKKEALHALEQAIDLGFKNRRLLDEAPEFGPLRDNPRFKSLVSRLPSPQTHKRDRRASNRDYYCFLFTHDTLVFSRRGVGHP